MKRLPCLRGDLGEILVTGVDGDEFVVIVWLDGMAIFLEGAQRQIAVPRLSAVRRASLAALSLVETQRTIGQIPEAPRIDLRPRVSQLVVQFPVRPRRHTGLIPFLENLAGLVISEREALDENARDVKRLIVPA